MTRLGMLRAAVVGALACAAIAAPAAATAASFSDSFAARESVAGFGLVTGSNAGAGKEAGEPALKPLSPAGHTVWVEWEATSSGYVTLSSCASGIDTVLGVYAGSQLDSLADVGSAATHRPPSCSGVRDGVTFPATSGQRFQIVLDGNAFLPFGATAITEGPLSLSIEATPRPPNDDFADATAIAGRTTEEPGGARFYFASSFDSNWAAGKEPGEPNHAGDPGGASIWYSWTAPETRLARVSVCCSAVRLLAVYLGDALGSLTAVTAGRGQVEFPAVTGSTYRIAVDGELGSGGPAQGNVNLAVSMNPPNRPIGEEGRYPLEPIVSGPPRKHPPATWLIDSWVRQKKRTATYAFTSNAAGATFRCRLDKGRWVPCTSPRTYRKLRPGAHVFRVYAIDAAGDVDRKPVVSRFSIRPQRRHGPAADH